MPFIDFFLRQEVTIRPYSHRGNGGDVYKDAEKRKCRIERGCNLATTYKNPDGEVVQTVAHAKMWCLGTPIPAGSIVIHTDDNGITTEMVVIQSRVATGFADDHLEVLLE